MRVCAYNLRSSLGYFGKLAKKYYANRKSTKVVGLPGTSCHTGLTPITLSPVPFHCFIHQACPLPISRNANHATPHLAPPLALPSQARLPTATVPIIRRLSAPASTRGHARSSSVHRALLRLGTPRACTCPHTPTAARVVVAAIELGHGAHLARRARPRHALRRRQYTLNIGHHPSRSPCCCHPRYTTSWAWRRP